MTDEEAIYAEPFGALKDDDSPLYAEIGVKSEYATPIEEKKPKKKMKFTTIPPPPPTGPPPPPPPMPPPPVPPKSYVETAPKLNRNSSKPNLPPKPSAKELEAKRKEIMEKKSKTDGKRGSKLKKKKNGKQAESDKGKSKSKKKSKNKEVQEDFGNDNFAPGFGTVRDDSIQKRGALIEAVLNFDGKQAKKTDTKAHEADKIAKSDKEEFDPGFGTIRGDETTGKRGDLIEAVRSFNDSETTGFGSIRSESSSRGELIEAVRHFNAIEHNDTISTGFRTLHDHQSSQSSEDDFESGFGTVKTTNANSRKPLEAIGFKSQRVILDDATIDDVDDDCEEYEIPEKDYPDSDSSSETETPIANPELFFNIADVTTDEVDVDLQIPEEVPNVNQNEVFSEFDKATLGQDAIKTFDTFGTLPRAKLATANLQDSSFINGTLPKG